MALNFLACAVNFHEMRIRELLIGAAESWGSRAEQPLSEHECPDQVDRRNPAVDLLSRDVNGEPRLVLEHTLVESFPDQRSKQTAAVLMFKPLEDEFAGGLPEPGRYDLYVKPGSVLGLKAKSAEIQHWVRAWILDVAPNLVIGHPSTAPNHLVATTVPGTELRITLGRWPGRRNGFRLIFEAPKKNDDGLALSLQKAAAAKCPKLAQAREQNEPAESLLLLEIADLALGDLFELDTAVTHWLADERHQVPDNVWLADTTNDPPWLLISKERSRIGDEIENRFFLNLLRLDDSG